MGVSHLFGWYEPIFLLKAPTATKLVACVPMSVMVWDAGPIPHRTAVFYGDGAC